MRYFIILITVFFLSCNGNKPIEVDNQIIFTGDDGIYKGNNLIFNKELLPKICHSDYDDSYDNYWIHSINEKSLSLFQYVLSDGTLSDPIIISYEMFVPMSGGAFFVSKNIALVNRKVLVNLETNEIKHIKMELPKFSILFGFNGEYVFGENWYYDINSKDIIYFPESLKFFMYSEKADKILAISDKNTIVIYDYRENRITDTGLVKKNTSDNYYEHNRCYYLIGDDLYFTKPKRRKMIQTIFHYLFFMKNYPVNWYRYNMISKESTLIYSPTEFSIILGSRIE